VAWEAARLCRREIGLRRHWNDPLPSPPKVRVAVREADMLEFLKKERAYRLRWWNLRV